MWEWIPEWFGNLGAGKTEIYENMAHLGRFYLNSDGAIKYMEAEQ